MRAELALLSCCAAFGARSMPDCESVLLEDGSMQEHIWGADWNPQTQQVTYEALINIRPRQNNRAMEILDPAICERVGQIAQKLLGGV